MFPMKCEDFNKTFRAAQVNRFRKKIRENHSFKKSFKIFIYTGQLYSIVAA